MKKLILAVCAAIGLTLPAFGGGVPISIYPSYVLSTASLTGGILTNSTSITNYYVTSGRYMSVFASLNSTAASSSNLTVVMYPSNDGVNFANAAFATMNFQAGGTSVTNYSTNLECDAISEFKVVSSTTAINTGPLTNTTVTIVSK